ncbi:hypothetical protein, partial [uncultured Shewanella sp.]|uniref:hypothetical protein n=1 Tax=uncultured Shewanella sp. TaxID=173975 RepID=UPI00262899F9
PEKDSWHGIKAYANSTVTLRHTQISHAANGLYVYLIDPNGYAATINVTHSHFSHNVNGIQLGDIRDHSDSRYKAFTPVIQFSDFIDNDINIHTVDTNSYRNTIVDARYNWWNTTDFSEISAKITGNMSVNYGQYRLSDDVAD